MEIDIGIGGLEFGSGVTRFPGLVFKGLHLPVQLQQYENLPIQYKFLTFEPTMQF